MMKWKIGYAAAALCAVVSLCTGAAAQKNVGTDVYFIDTEGGASTLIVSPGKESVLIDCGSEGERDASRIYHVAHDIAHLKQIDSLIITHWHLDHYGGTGPLSKLIPIKKFYNKGIPDQTLDDPDHFPALIAAYKTACGGQYSVIKTGDTIPLAGSPGAAPVSLFCLIANKQTLPDDNSPAARNGYAKLHKPAPVDTSDNANSLGFLIKVGNFRMIDLGDLTWNLEYTLISPNNKVGLVDVYQTTHHGIDQSNNPAIIKSIRPVVAVINNGPHKGGTPQLFKNLLDTGSMTAIFEQHRYLDAPAPTAGDLQDRKLFVANQDEKCKGEFIHIQIDEKGDNYQIQIGDKGRFEKFRSRLAEDKK
jgi:competence protein ComEC